MGILEWVVISIILGSGTYLGVESYNWEKECAKECGALGVEKCELKDKVCECYD